jgi:predicted nucleic acid-binding protein
MIRALLDTNVILDALLAREPVGGQVRAVWEAHEDGHFTGYICAITPPTVFYVARKAVGKSQAFKMTGDLAETFEVCAVDRGILQSAMRLEMPDFEDAIQSASALAAGLDFVITSDLKDYKKSPVKAISPVEFMKQLG